MTTAGCRAVLAIFQSWNLTDDAGAILLGDIGAARLRSWREGLDRGSLSLEPQRDFLVRLSLVLGIYKALHVLFPTREVADGWIKRPINDPAFGGQCALDVMLQGSVEDLYRVRRYLDGQRS